VIHLKVSKIDFVSTFEVDPSITLSCGPILKDLQKKLGGKVISINAPEEAPPPMPRVILQTSDTILNVGFDRFQVTSIPPSHIANDFSGSLNFARQRSIMIISMLIKEVNAYKWSGVIADFEYPEIPLVSKSAFEAGTPLFDRLINIDRRGRPLGSFQLQYGINDLEHYTTYTINIYEVREVPIPDQKKPGFIFVEPFIYPLAECGVRIALDVNSRPHKGTIDPITDLDVIVEKVISSQKTLIQDLNLEGILK